MNRIQTSLLERSTQQIVEATLVTELTVDAVCKIEATWSETRIESARRLHQSGNLVPEHWHWDWSKKAQKLKFLAYQCMAIECSGTVQGLIMTSTTRFLARLEPDVGKPLLYVEYLEAAPWNVKPIVESPRYAGVGIRLIEAALHLSNEEGFHGRLGLHSLPQAESFYGDRCHMLSLGPDSSCQDLPYYEMTRTQATEFLAEEEPS